MKFALLYERSVRNLGNSLLEIVRVEYNERHRSREVLASGMRFGQPQMQPRSFLQLLLFCIGASLTFFLSALWIGIMQGKTLLTLSLIGGSILLEAQPAALASVPLGFHPVPGAVISILANCIPLPFLLLMFQQITRRWRWLGRKLKKAEKWSGKFGRYGVWGLVLLSPFLGAYASVAVSYGLGWNPVRALISILIGMVASAFIITTGGYWVVSLFHHANFLALHIH
ncbi:MAG: small multi-drug export protein [Alicyclobacillaceae bacterium]|nr:small multi-drug export protein [Alicyclobacillaceae bacterium]